MGIAMQEWPRRHRISVAHYYRMTEAGLFEPDERVELIDGEIVDMPPMGARHAGKLSRLVGIVSSAIGDRGIVRCRLPLRLGDLSEPQPDLAVVRPSADYYEHQHPTADDALLAVELGDATLRFDRDIKAPLYARHGVPELWIVDLRAERLLVLRAPADGRYTAVAETALGRTGIVGLPGVVVDLEPLQSRPT